MNTTYFETQKKLLKMILRSLYPLRKTLMQVDPIYNSVSDYMTIDDRLSYCRSLMAETEYFLNSSSSLLNEKTVEKYKTIILAAHMEIERLATHQVSER